jgi:hypothetical protein
MMVPLAGCGESAASQSSTGSFLGKASNAVILIQWTRNGNAVSGSLQQTLLKDPAGSGISTQQISFTGTLAGNGLTLQLNQDLGTTTSLVGTLSDPGFTLTYPGSASNLIQIPFTPGQISDYNQAVNQLQVSQYGSPCNLYLEGHDAQITISGPDAVTDCQTFVQADSADTWTTQQQAGSGGSQVCDVVTGADEVVVNDDGFGQTYGRQACSTFANQGWSPKSSSTTSSTSTTGAGPNNSILVVACDLANSNTGTGVAITNTCSYTAGHRTGSTNRPTPGSFDPEQGCTWSKGQENAGRVVEVYGLRLISR